METQKATLEVKLKDKILSVNDANISLDDSLFNADSFNKEGIDYLELQYKTKDEEVSYNEAEKIYSVLENQGIDNIEVSPCPEGRDYQTVALFGEFNAQIYQK